MKLQNRTRTKIICTIGPKSDNCATLRELKRNGMDISRINMSHGTHETHQKTIDNIVRIRENDVYPGIALDTKGPEMRLKIEGPLEIKEGEKIKLSGLDGNGQIKINFANMGKIKKGMLVLIDDGKLQLEVVQVQDGKEIICRAQNSHVVLPNKAVNIPDAGMDESVPTEKDRDDILFGLKNRVDYIFLSFVNNATEIRNVRAFIRGMGDHMPVIIAKIESKESVKNINEIIAEADGIMVARGDLSVEIGLKYSFSAQKMITKKCLQKKKPVIMATQMLESMCNNGFPTRAEISDIGNAVLDSCDCVMLSGETAAGHFPALSVKTMKTVINDAEFFKYGEQRENAKILLIFMNNYSDHVVELKYSYKVPIVVISKNEKLLRGISHHLGFFSFKMGDNESQNEALKRAVAFFKIDKYEWVVVEQEEEIII